MFNNNNKFSYPNWEVMSYNEDLYSKNYNNLKIMSKVAIIIVFNIH